MGRPLDSRALDMGSGRRRCGYGRERSAAKRVVRLIVVVAVLALSASAQAQASRTGLASYYSRSLHGGLTASGDRFDNAAMVAAHPTLPFGTVLRVTNLENGRTVTVRVVDRGPAPGPRNEGVILDVSRAAARRLGFLRVGRASVRLDVMSEPAERDATDSDRS